jgi:hypothetical protein
MVAAFNYLLPPDRRDFVVFEKIVTLPFPPTPGMAYTLTRSGIHGEPDIRDTDLLLVRYDLNEECFHVRLSYDNHGDTTTAHDFLESGFRQSYPEPPPTPATAVRRTR